MSEKTITRDEFDAAVVAGWGTNQPMNIAKVTERMFEAAGITVESKPILPDVTPGEWDSKQRNLVNRPCQEFPCEVWGYSKEGIKITIGWVRELRDAEVMAGSKKLVRAITKWLLKERVQFKNMSPELQEVVNAVAETSADVTEIIK